MTPRQRRQRVIIAAIGAAYLVLLALSFTLREPREPVDQIPPESRAGVALPAFDADGTVDLGRGVVVSALDVRRADERGEPVIFLHGSPGGLDNVAGLEPHLQDAGRRTVTLDLPGFGLSDHEVPDVGARAHARYVLALMDEWDIGRAHVVGWSNGGAVALNMADIDPARVATVTLLASVGVQETEGSGSYAFEHAKYKSGRIAFRALQLGTPHFGLFGWSARDFDWLRNFDDTDQRALRPIMETLETPTLILHGRHDFLTPAWGAELHHEIIPTSRLVMLDASHFMPFLQAEESAAIMEGFFARHDAPGVEPVRAYEDRAPSPERTGAARAIEWVGEGVRRTPWWALVPALALLARWRPELAAVLAGMYVGRVDLDLGVAVLGLFIGRLARPATPFDGRRLPLGWVGTLVWTAASVLIVFLLEQDTFPWRLGPDDAALRLGAAGFVVCLIVLPALLHVARNLPRRRGRQRLRAQWAHIRSHEHWPSWVLYLPVWPIWLAHAFKPGGILAFTAANPGIPDGGGITGESKARILRSLGTDPRVLAHELVPAGPPPADRAEAAIDAAESRRELGGFPIILKPDAGERGADVRLAREPSDARAFFERVREDAVVQRYAPGPAEFGVLWIRHPAAVAHDPPEGARAGSIFAITDKRFPAVRGDARRTLGELILAHPRGRAQADILFKRFRGRLGEVPAKGEHVTFTRAGNHAQGCAFHDGADLITPELERAIDGIARGYADDEGRGLDFGRFDIRCPSREHLGRAEGLEIVELNGVTSEATNHYDPGRSAFFAWGLLRRQWKRLYEVSEARIAAGAQPLTWRAFIRIARSQRQPSGTTD